MISCDQHTYLKTRATVMGGQLLTENELASLLTAPLPQLESRFGLTGLSETEKSRPTINRLVEHTLINTLMKELSALLRPLSGEPRESLVYWSRKFELFNLKALIRGKLHEQQYEEIRDTLYPLPALISLPHDRLLRTESIPELLRQLEQTPYQGIARQARLVFEAQSEPFSLDAAIDRSYYTGLVKRGRNCDLADQTELMKLIGTLIDCQNIPWLLRYRFNYRLSPTETYYLMVLSGGHLHADQLKQLVNLPDPAQVLDALPSMNGHSFNGQQNTMQVEQTLNRLLIGQATNSLLFSASAAARSLAYLILREIELRRVLGIILGRILRLDESLIRDAIELQPGTAGV